MIKYINSLYKPKMEILPKIKKNVDIRVQTLDKSICEGYSTGRLKTHIANTCETLNISMNRSGRFNCFFFLFNEGNSTLPLLYFNCLPIQSPRHG